MCHWVRNFWTAWRNSINALGGIKTNTATLALHWQDTRELPKHKGEVELCLTGWSALKRTPAAFYQDLFLTWMVSYLCNPTSFMPWVKPCQRALVGAYRGRSALPALGTHSPLPLLPPQCGLPTTSYRCCYSSCTTSLKFALSISNRPQFYHV